MLCYRVFSRDVTKFKIFPRKLPPPCWCPFAAYKVSWIYGHLHYKRCLRRKMTLPNCLNMQIHLILLLRKGTCACIGVDPFLISCQKYYAECLPPTESIDLVSYLVLETSHYNKEQFKAFKSLQAYNQLVSGFVQSVLGLIIAGKHVSRELFSRY